MKRLLILALLLVLAGTGLSAQSDYYQKKATEYTREAEYYQKKAQGYRQEAEYYLKKAADYNREAEYYLRKGDTDRAKYQQKYAQDATDKAGLQMKWAREAEERPRCTSNGPPMRCEDEVFLRGLILCVLCVTLFRQRRDIVDIQKRLDRMRPAVPRP